MNQQDPTPDAPNEEDAFAGVAWHDGHALAVDGRGWSEGAGPYRRLPDRAEGVVRDEVWERSRSPVGVSVRFATDATDLFVRWRLDEEPAPAFHETALRQAGLDCYGRADDGRWLWVGKQDPWRFPEPNGKLNEKDLDGAFREYRVYLPLGREVERLDVGVHERFGFEPVEPDTRRPIVVYGTSICHGSGVTRPGLAWPSVMQRRLDYPLVNLGFAGNGRMEPEVMRFINEIDFALLVVDCLPNMDLEQIQRNGPALVSAVREHRGDVPILFVSDRAFGDAAFQPERPRTQAAKSGCQARFVERLRAAGDENLHLIEPANYFGEDTDGTVDASHPNDLGASRMADVVTPHVRRILGLGG
jgi:hypothetical protein